MTRTVAPVLVVLLAALPAAAQTPQPLTIRFAATAGGAAVGCGTSLSSIGTTRSTVNIVDFRFYVSKLRLIKADGSETPVALTQDGLWQVDDVALLDFEDATGACANGTPETRSVIEGTVPAGDYTGVRFDVGLPFDKNHADSTLAPSPLNLSRMFWSWNAGYKFIRLDIRTSGQPRGWLVHLGSTGCSPTGSASTAPVSCTNRNAVAVDLPSFAPAREVVEMDVAALFAASNVDVNTEKTALGCMSGPTDPECAGLFEQLGLAIGEKPAGAQKVFRAKAAATIAR